jgi:hypothetical protein
MTSSDTLIRNEIEKDDRAIQRAVERGGLPNETEVVAIYKVLGDASDALEAVTWRVEGVALSDVGRDVPEVTLEQLGVLALLIDDVTRESEDLTRFVERLRTSVSSLNAIRAEQQQRREVRNA